jgi:hypothetical protein
MKKLFLKFVDWLCVKAYDQSMPEAHKKINHWQREAIAQAGNNKVLSANIVKLSQFYTNLKNILANRSIEINGRGHYVSLLDVKNLVMDYEKTGRGAQKAPQTNSSVEKTAE